MDGMKLFAIYLAVMNVIGVAVMWSDKKRARLHWYFVAGMPLILVCQAALAIYLVRLYVL